MKVTPNGNKISVFYSESLFTGGFSGLLFCVIIKSKYRNDIGLHIHEYTHIDQQIRDGCLRWCWRYYTSSEWRLKYEVEAYRAQLAVYGPVANKEFAIVALMNKYWLNITRDKVILLLS